MLTAFKQKRLRIGLSERAVAEKVNLSRSTLRGIESSCSSTSVQTLAKYSDNLNQELTILLSPRNCNSEFSTVATAYKIMENGINSWKIHLMDLVDEFRRDLDPQLILLPPPSQLDTRITALMASTIRFLCKENSMDLPSWAKKNYFLPNPWFVSETESLKASALKESPTCFRENNIFVLHNFLNRA